MSTDITMNQFEFKLKQGGLQEPITTYIADEFDLDKLAARRYPTASIPAWNASIKGAIVFDSTTNKLKVAGASGWETITSA